MIRRMVQCFCHGSKLAFFGSVMTSDWIYDIGHVGKYCSTFCHFWVKKKVPSPKGRTLFCASRHRVDTGPCFSDRHETESFELNCKARQECLWHDQCCDHFQSQHILYAFASYVIPLLSLNTISTNWPCSCIWGIGRTWKVTWRCVTFSGSKITFNSKPIMDPYTSGALWTQKKFVWFGHSSWKILSKLMFHVISLTTVYSRIHHHTCIKIHGVAVAQMVVNMSECPWSRHWTPNCSWFCTTSLQISLWMGECKTCKVKVI